MGDGYIPQNLTELVNHFVDRQSPFMWVTPREIASAITQGVVKEPQEFRRFVDTFLDHTVRTRPDLGEVARRNALLNMAVFVLLSDHGYEDGIIEDALHGEVSSMWDYYKNPDKYGPAMSLLSSYLGKSKGEQTAEVLMVLENRRD